MRKLVFFTFMILLGFIHVKSQTTTDPLGIAGTFNGFILGTMNHPGGDSEGAVAVGGNGNFSPSFTIGDENLDGYGLVVGGNCTFPSGTIQHGDVHVGGTSSIGGGVILDGTLYNPSTPIDFAVEEAYLKDLSAEWRDLTPNGTIDLQAWGGLTLTGTDVDLNVFSLTEAQFKGTGQLNVIVPVGSTVIINVAGTSDNIPGTYPQHPFWGNMEFNGVNSASAWHNAIWNFHEMATFSLTGVGWKGSILAPYADVTYNNGNIEGTLIAKSLTNAGSAELHLYYFTGEAPIPSPGPPADGTVSGHLYIDTNGNGIQDGAEPDLAYIDVIVTDANSVDQTVTSDGNGDWSATVPPGPTSAHVDETDPDFPAGYIQTEGDDPTNVTAIAGSDIDAGIDGYYVIMPDDFVVCLKNSSDVLLSGGILEFRENKDDGWIIATEIVDGKWVINTTYDEIDLRMSYENSQEKQLDVYTATDFCFETVPVTVQLTAPDCTTPAYNNGLVEYGGLNGYQPFGNTGLTGESGTGIIVMEMLPVPTTFNMIWKGIVGRVDMQDLATNQVVTFCTKEVCVELKDSKGDGIDGAQVHYNGHGWQYMGETGDTDPGRVCDIMLANAVDPYDVVNFRIIWECGKIVERFDYTTPDPAVWTIQTVAVTAKFIGTDGNPKAGADIYYRKRCTQFMGTSGSNGDEVTREMLPAPYSFWAEYGGLETPITNQNVAINPIVKLRERSLKSEFAGGDNEMNIATFPNPLSNSTTIGFTNPEMQHVVVAVFDVQGRQVASIYDGTLTEGNQKFTWNASNQESGIYILRIITKDGIFHSNMVKY